MSDFRYDDLLVLFTVHLSCHADLGAFRRLLKPDEINIRSSQNKTVGKEWPVD